jgi:hypothetical protein
LKTTRYRDQGDDIADTKIIEQQDHVGMMRSPHLWPMKRTLPLKKRNHGFKDENLAFILFDTVRPCRLYYGVVGLAYEKYEDFASFEDIAAAGWEVD